MCKKLRVVFLTACIMFCSGCNLIEGVVSNVGGWDVSACVSGFSTCWELFTDNADKFEGGFVEAIGELE